MDWLIQCSDDPAAPVLAFRTRCRPDQPLALLFSAERIPDHRAFYLQHEGSVSGGRGTVHRMAAGSISELVLTPHSLTLDVDFGQGAARLEGAERSGGVWVFERGQARR